MQIYPFETQVLSKEFHVVDSGIIDIIIPESINSNTIITILKRVSINGCKVNWIPTNLADCSVPSIPVGGIMAKKIILDISDTYKVKLDTVDTAHLSDPLYFEGLLLNFDQITAQDSANIKASDLVCVVGENTTSVADGLDCVCTAINNQTQAIIDTAQTPVALSSPDQTINIQSTGENTFEIEVDPEKTAEALVNDPIALQTLEDVLGHEPAGVTSPSGLLTISEPTEQQFIIDPVISSDAGNTLVNQNGLYVPLIESGRSVQVVAVFKDGHVVFGGHVVNSASDLTILSVVGTPFLQLDPTNSGLVEFIEDGVYLVHLSPSGNNSASSWNNTTDGSQWMFFDTASEPFRGIIVSPRWVGGGGTHILKKSMGSTSSMGLKWSTNDKTYSGDQGAVIIATILKVS